MEIQTTSSAPRGKDVRSRTKILTIKIWAGDDADELMLAKARQFVLDHPGQTVRMLTGDDAS